MEVPIVNSALSTCQRQRKSLPIGNGCPCQKAQIHRVPDIGIRPDTHFASVIKLFLSWSKWISTNLFSYSSVSSWISFNCKNIHTAISQPSETVVHLCMLGTSPAVSSPSKENSLNWFIVAHVVYCIVQFHHSWQGSTLLQLATGGGEEMVKHFVQLVCWTSQMYK